jgi:hypothetical protein
VELGGFDIGEVGFADLARVEAVLDDVGVAEGCAAAAGRGGEEGIV